MNKDVFLFVMGAGASYSSGIDIYTDNFNFLNKDFERLSSYATLMLEPESVIAYYNKFAKKVQNIHPSDELQTYFKLFCSSRNVYIANQNVDGLLNRIGIQNNYEIHGSLHRQIAFKASDGKTYLRPDVVLYGQDIKPCYNDFCDVAEYWNQKLLFDPDYKDAKIHVVYWGTSNRFGYTDFIKNYADIPSRGFIFEINPNPVTPYKNYENFMDFYKDFLREKLYD